MISKDYHRIITAVYRQYNSDKVSEVASLLGKYEGQEEALLQSIYTKYDVSINEKIRFERADIEPPTTTEIHNNEISATRAKPSRKYWIGGVLLLFLSVISVWLYSSGEKKGNYVASIQKEEVIPTEPPEQNISNRNKKYPSLVLGDLVKLRRNPDKAALLTAKGYQLSSTEKDKKTFIGTLGDTVVIEKGQSGVSTQISWWSGTNRKWLYNHMRNEIIKRYEYSEMLSNNDETDNRFEGLPYFEDECYLDRDNIRYRTYSIYQKGKVIGYGVTIKEEF